MLSAISHLQPKSNPSHLCTFPNRLLFFSQVEKWFGQAKELSAIKTTCSHIQNMIIGVTKGFKYRMKMVYAHFPTNVQVKHKAIALFFIPRLFSVKSTLFSFSFVL